MKLVSFSVENYRSITTARKIPLSDYSLLVGANNEGKSNILHALALGMGALARLHLQTSKPVQGSVKQILSSPLTRRSRRMGYDWEVDFPVSKQSSSKGKKATDITLEFQLDEQETLEFRENIKSNLNGTLPLLISFSQNDFSVTVKKQGRGKATLTKKSNKIANFVSKRIRFEYIPAIRTAQSASRVIEQLLDRELYKLEADPDYLEAVKKIEELQRPVFAALAETIQETVAGFLPSVKAVELSSRVEARFRSLRRDVEIIVDDGNLTKLERKGDGVQSLVALALMRHASENNSNCGSMVIAIEEPEAHLHPRAVHELRSVIERLIEKNQVVLTSHSPLFVDRDNLKHTIIVEGSKAKTATHVSAVREALGVRFSDNLENARLVLLVEGTDDVIALRSIISTRSDVLAAALESGTVTFDHLSGASKLSFKASHYQASACLVQAFIDDDKAGREAVQKAHKERVLDVRDVNLCCVAHLNEAELEDLYDKSVYSSAFLNEFGVDPRGKLMGKPKQKWSNNTKKLFKQSGKPWDDTVKLRVKLWLAEFAKSNAERILKEELIGPIDNFIKTAEAKLPKRGS